MIGRRTVFGLCIAGVASLVVSLGVVLGAAPSPVPTPAQHSQDGVENSSAPAARIEEPPTPTRWNGLGMQCRRVPAALATQLGLAEGRGILVEAVEADSPAAGAGLERHDVILTVDREEARLEGLAGFLESGGGLALGVVRAGVERRVAILGGERDGEGDGFLSTDSLGPDHPFRRLSQIETLRATYAKRSERVGELMRELDEQSRQAREDASQAVVALQEACSAQVAEVLAAKEKELLAIVDRHLGAARVEPLGGLRVDLARVLPAEELEALERALESLADTIETPAESARLVGDERTQRDELRRARQSLSALGKEMSGLLEERLVRPWKEGRRESERHRERLASKHDQRVEWAATTVESIREHVRGRITCAVARANERFSKELRQRLRVMQVPAPGEVEAAVADLSGQLEEMTLRFVRRTEDALALYHGELAERRGALAPALAAHLAAGQGAVAELGGALDGLLEVSLSRELVLDGTWRGRAALERVIDELSIGLRRALNAGRNGLRGASVGLVHDLREERVVSEDAWRDLQRLLQGLQSEASNNCWKLDGPHLDGRFPRPDPRPDARVRRGDEVALVTR